MNEETPSLSDQNDNTVSEQTPAEDTSEKNYNRKKLKTIQKLCDQYSTFLTLLLGRSLDKGDFSTLNKLWGSFNNESQEMQIPDAVIKFPNPDYKKQSQHSISAIEAYDIIQQLIKSENGDLEQKILLKACEGVIAQLDNYDTHSKKSSQNARFLRQKLRRENQFIEFENTEETKRLEISYEEENKEKIKNKLIIQLNNRLTGSQQLDLDQNKINDAFEIQYSMLKSIPDKKMFKGGYLTQINKKQWEKSKKDTKDFSTLVRNIIMIMLSKQGYYLSLFISQNSKYIFCSLFATEESLKIQAQSSGLQKLLNIQFIDLFSFEPLDKSYRPLRLNNRIWKPQQYEESMFLDYLRPMLKRLIIEIDFKKIAREVNQSNINQKLFHYGLDQYDDNEAPNDAEWMAYYLYLTHLNQRLQGIRKNGKINNDIAAVINQQITPQNLLQRRRKGAQYEMDMNNLTSTGLEKFQLSKIEEIILEMNNTINEYQNIFNLSIVPYTKLISVLKKEKKAKQYLDIFKESLKVANQGKQYLHCLWDRLNLREPINMKAEYSNPSKDRSLHHQHCQLMCWKKYQLNQGEKVTIFQSSERLRLAYLNVFALFPMRLLKEKGLTSQFFCLHDNFELYGLYYQHYHHLSKNREQFYQEKLFDIASQLTFNIIDPMKMKFSLICQYFGESVGSYFFFLCYFSEMLLIQTLLGSIYYSIMMLESNQEIVQIFQLIYIILQLQVTSFYSSKWNRQLKTFFFQHSVNSQEDISTSSSRVIGQPKRSLVDDSMNEIQIDEVDFTIRQCISMLLFILLQSLCAVIFIALYFLCVWLRTFISVSEETGSMEVIVVASLHICLNKIYSSYSTQIVIQLVDFECQRTIQAIKQSLNLKLYSFLIIQQLGPLLILRFFNAPLKLICAGDLCNQYIGYYFLTYISFKSIEKLIIFLHNFYTLKSQPLFIYKFQQQDIEEYIETQSKKPSNIIGEYYNKIEENIQQNMVELTILSYFAFIYPISYLFQWLLFIVQIYADKAQYVYYYQRPWPQINCFDQVWNNILTYITFSSIIISCFGLSNIYQFENFSQTFVYVSTLLMSFTLNFVYQLWYSETPSVLQQLLGRQKYLVKSTLENFKKKAKTQKVTDTFNLKRMVIYKVYGSSPQSQDGLYETLSSDSDLESYYIDKKLANSPILQDYQRTDKKKYSIKGKISKRPMLVRSSTFYEQILSAKDAKKIDYNKIKTFKKADLLINHKRSWLDLRFQQRNFYFRRKSTTLQNLNEIKYQIIRDSLKFQKEQATDFIMKLYRRKIAKLKDSKEEHDQKELKTTYEKIRKYVNKQKWLNCRKFIVFKVKKAVWFHSFRKTILKLSSKILIDKFQKELAMEPVEKNQSNFEHFEKNNKNVDLKEISLANLITYSQEYNKNQIKLIPLAAGYTNLKFYSSSQKKSNVFTSIIEKVRDTYVFETQKSILHQIMMEYFYEEQFPIPEINFVKQLNDTSWLALVDNKKEPQLIQFLQLKHGKKLSFLPELNADRGISYIQGMQYIRLANYIDRIDDFYLKGYCVIIYNKAPIASLYTVIKFRKKLNLHYTQEELLTFLYDNLLLLLREEHGDISTRNYLLENSQYYLVNSIKSDQSNDLKSLAKVLISMITLNNNNQDTQKALDDLYKHDLYDILTKMIEGDTNISEILSKIKYQDKFQESFIVQKIENQKENQCDFQEYLQMTLHRANFSLRVKQLDKGVFYVHQFEIILHRQIYKSGNNALEAFQNYIINNFMKYTIHSADMEDIIQVIMVFFMKFSICIQLRKKTTLQKYEIDIMINCINDLIKNLDLILIQLQLNINLEQMTKQEANALFGLNQAQTGNIIRLKHYERIRLINTLRLSKKNIENLFSFRKTIRRFQNQIQVIKCMTHYFKLEMPIASKIIDDCIEVQMELIKSKNKLEITKELKDLNPDLYNYNQVSPKENKIDAFTFQVNSSMNLLCEEDPAYFHQLLYYYYLQIMIWHDTDDNDQYLRKIRTFLSMDIRDSPTFDFFCNQLKGLIEDEIPIKYINQELQCEIGKFQVIKLQKWLEQTYGHQSNIIKSSDLRYMWKQIMTYSNLQQNLHNKQILHDQLKIDPFDLKTQLYLIRILHQILHLDCYFPLNQQLSQLKYNIDEHDRVVINYSYITKLQNLHHEISVPFNSWFHSNGMLQFRAYHIASIFFAFSPKHIESLFQVPSLKDLGKNALYTMRLQKDNRDILMKTYQILLDDEFLIIDTNIKPQQIYQMIYSYVSLKISKQVSLVVLFQEIEQLVRSSIQPSILLLLFLQILLQAQKYEQMDFLIQFTKRLLEIKAQIFQYCHENFLNDLCIMELYIPNKVTDLSFIAPYDLLFTRSPQIKFFQDTNVYTRYLIHHCFFHQNYTEIIEYLEDNLIQIKKNQELLKLKELTEHMLIYLKISLGIIKQEKTQDYIVLILQQLSLDHDTLIDAINKYILIKIYTNLKEYELALPYSNQVLQYFYIYENSKFIELSGMVNGKVSKSLTKFQELLSIFVKSDISINIQQEPHDVYYCHLIDNEFICEILLTHIEIQCNLRIFNASVFSILHLLDKTANNYQIAYIYKLLAEIFQSNVPDLKFDSKVVEQAKSVVRERKLLIKQFQSFRHRQTADDILKYNLQLAKLTYQQIVYQKFSRKPQPDEILFLIQISAEKSLEFFTQLSVEQTFTNHFFFIQLHIILADTYLEMQNFTVAFQNLDIAEENALEIYGRMHHPQVGYFLLSRNIFRKKQQNIQIQLLKELRQSEFFEVSQIKTIALLLLQENKSMILFMDYFRKTKNISAFYKNTKDLIKMNQTFCDNFLHCGASSTVDDIFEEILRLFPSLGHSQVQNYLSASHHFVYLDERNQYRMKINEILRNE